MSTLHLLHYGRKSLTALALAIPMAALPAMVSTSVQAQSAMCIPTIDRATAQRVSLTDVIDVTLAQAGNLTDEEIAAVVRDIAGSRACGVPVTNTRLVKFYQPLEVQPRLAY